MNITLEPDKRALNTGLMYRHGGTQCVCKYVSVR